MNRVGRGLAAAVLVVALSTPLGALAQTVPRSLFYHLGEPVADPAACAMAAGAKLQALGYRVAKPTTSAHGDSTKDRSGVSVLCAHEDGPLLIFSDLGKIKRSATFEANALQGALRSAIWSRPSAAPQPAPIWSTDPSQRYRAVRRFAIDRKVRCLTLAKRALEPLGFDAYASDEELRSVVAVSKTGQNDGVSISCETPGEVLVAITGERDAAIDRLPVWNKVMAALPPAVPAAETPPLLDVWVAPAAGDGACLDETAAVLTHFGLKVSRPSSDMVYGSGGSGAWAMRCPGGEAALLVAALHETVGGYTDISLVLRKTFPKPNEPRGAPMGLESPPLITTMWRSKLGEPRECRDAAAIVFKAAGWTPDYPRYWPNLSDMTVVMAQRDTLGVSGAIICGKSAYGMVMAHSAGFASAPEIQALETALLAQTPKPMWRRESTRHLDVQMPRAGVLQKLTGPEGERDEIRARYQGVEYVAWELAPPAGAPFDAEAALEAQKARLEASGVTVVQAQRSPFKSAPSTVVWTTRTEADGKLVRGAARYVAFKGRLYGLEALYPDGANPAAELQTFSESMSIRELY